MFHPNFNIFAGDRSSSCSYCSCTCSKCSLTISAVFISFTSVQVVPFQVSLLARCSIEANKSHFLNCLLFAEPEFLTSSRDSSELSVQLVPVQDSMLYNLLLLNADVVLLQLAPSCLRCI
jgi:hypothetical protein